MQNAAENITLSEKAVAVYARASKLKPDNADFISIYAEARELFKNWQPAINAQRYSM